MEFPALEGFTKVQEMKTRSSSHKAESKGNRAISWPTIRSCTFIIRWLVGWLVQSINLFVRSFFTRSKFERRTECSAKLLFLASIKRISTNAMS